MKDTVYVLVFNGLADWEPALALCEIRKSERYRVVTLGFTADPVVSMGGLRILPDDVLSSIDPAQAALLVLPGGDLWEQGGGAAAVDVLRHLHDEGVPVAAICGATLGAARAGLLDARPHTSNMPGYIGAMVPSYTGADYYEAGALAVTDGPVITASGLGSVEFAHEIIQLLGLYDEPTQRVWFEAFRHGRVPEGYA